MTSPPPQKKKKQIHYTQMVILRPGPRDLNSKQETEHVNFDHLSGHLRIVPAFVVPLVGTLTGR